MNKTLDGEQSSVAAVHCHEEYNSNTGAFEFVEIGQTEQIQAYKVADSDIQATAMGPVIRRQILWNTTNKLCAGGVKDSDACEGDHSGPLIKEQDP